MQKNALRVETLRDTSPRCGLKMPSQWSESAKRRGWGLWLFSGGTASIFGHCDNNCPRRVEFIQTAPKKAWRRAALEMASAALKKQEPKKPTTESTRYGMVYDCNVCNCGLEPHNNYCPNCGQAIDLGEEK